MQMMRGFKGWGVGITYLYIFCFIFVLLLILISWLVHEGSCVFFFVPFFLSLYLVLLNHAHSIVIANDTRSKKNGGCWLMLGFGCGVRIWTLFSYVLFLVFSKSFFHSWSIMVVVIVSLFLHCFLWDLLHVRLRSEVNLKPRWADFNLWWSFMYYR